MKYLVISLRGRRPHFEMRNTPPSPGGRYWTLAIWLVV